MDSEQIDLSLLAYDLGGSLTVNARGELTTIREILESGDPADLKALERATEFLSRAASKIAGPLKLSVLNPEGDDD